MKRSGVTYITSNNTQNEVEQQKNFREEAIKACSHFICCSFVCKVKRYSSMALNKRSRMSESATTCEMSCEIADDFKILQLNQTPLDNSAKFSSERCNNNSISLNVDKCRDFNFLRTLARNLNNQ